jgi:hypothetical protein
MYAWKMYSLGDRPSSVLPHFPKTNFEGLPPRPFILWVIYFLVCHLHIEVLFSRWAKRYKKTHSF